MFKVLKDFNGSPNGYDVIAYKKDEEVELVPSLAEVAVKEKWVKEIPAPKPPVVVEPQGQLNPDNPPPPDEPANPPA